MHNQLHLPAAAKHKTIKANTEVTQLDDIFVNAAS